MRKEAFSRRSRAKRAKKCTKKCDARAKLLFCLLNLFFLFDVLVAVASMDLKVAYELASTLKPYFAMLGGKYKSRFSHSLI